MKLNEKIIYCRRKAGLSQENLAELLNVSRQAVSKWETGDALPEVNKLSRLAQIFGVTTDWLLSEDEEEEFNEEPIREQHSNENKPESMPNFVTRIIRRYGWLTGVYLGIGGVFILGLGLLAYFIAGSMINKFTDIVDQFGSFPLSSPIDVSVGSFGSPVIYISYAMMAVGGLFIIAGVILALVLKKKLQHKDS